MVDNKITELYNELIFQLLTKENVASVTCNRNYADNRFFDKIEVCSNGLVIYAHGLPQPFDSFIYACSLDFVSLLSQLEKAIYIARHGGKETEGLHISFKDEDNLDTYKVLVAKFDDDESLIDENEETFDNVGDAKKRYSMLVSEIEEEQGMSMNIKRTWDVRPCGDTINAERIDLCHGGYIIIELAKSYGL